MKKVLIFFGRSTGNGGLCNGVGVQGKKAETRIIAAEKAKAETPQTSKPMRGYGAVAASEAGKMIATSFSVAAAKKVKAVKKEKKEEKK